MSRWVCASFTLISGGDESPGLEPRVRPLQEAELGFKGVWMPPGGQQPGVWEGRCPEQGGREGGSTSMCQEPEGGQRR